MSKKRKKYYSNINGVEELKRQKKLLQKKIKVRERLLNKHINDFNDDFSGDYLYRQSVKTLKLDNALWKMAPQFFKEGKSKKGFIIPALSGLGAAIASFFFMKNKNTEKTSKSS